MEPEYIEVRNARVHNLQSVSLRLPRNQLICFTGVSGSGKSSLAFDTLYAEGQRRYIESLSSYARQFMGQMEKPDCDLISGLSPAIAIEQKTTGWNPRSTVGTVTAIHDFLRVLYARIGLQHCTQCGEPISAQTIDQIVGAILSEFGDGPVPNRELKGAAGATDKAKGARVLILAPVARKQKGEFRDTFEDLVREGYVRARVDGEVVSLRDDLSLEKNRRHDIEVVIDRIRVSASGRARLAEAVQSALGVGKGTLIVTPMADDDEAEGKAGKRGASDEKIFSSKYACTNCSISFEPPSPQLFSFNSPTGMCTTCGGLGELFDFDVDLLIPDPKKTFYAPCVAPLRTKPGRWRRHMFQGVADALGFDIKKPWKDLPKAAQDALLFGTGDRHITFTWRSYGKVFKHGGRFEGVVAELREKYRKAKAGFVREYYEKFMRRGACPECSGARLNAQALAVRLPTGARKRGPNLTELCAMSIGETCELFERLSLTPVQQVIAEEVLKEVRARLKFLLDVGLHYLSLERTAPTLSGGELQRIRLAGQIGSGLVGVMYVLDEPSIGLHARDNKRLLDSLIRLRDMGNTVIVVEHDEDTMRAADHIVDFGPGPGVRGGRVVAEGDYAAITANKTSLTGQFLTGEWEIAIPERRPVERLKSQNVKKSKSKVKKKSAGEASDTASNKRRVVKKVSQKKRR
ncbi:MAG TPA: excinuclease ABC subunit UvrA [Phycisphaerae bacterium]|nr:excinuclease ABC subunit UvrA [Phycisphaerae bacterium]